MRARVAVRLASVVALTLSSCGRDSTNVSLEVSVRSGTTSTRPGDPPLPILDWSPAKPAERIDVEECLDKCDRGSGRCTEPSSNAKTWGCAGSAALAAPPITYGLTPPGWVCTGTISLDASREYSVTVVDQADSRAGGSTCLGGIAAPHPRPPCSRSPSNSRVPSVHSCTPASPVRAERGSTWRIPACADAGDLGACGDGRWVAGGAEHPVHRALAATSRRRALRAAFPCGLGDPLAAHFRRGRETMQVA